nr:MAG TPA: hypothetical protein [Caudoviricetes sp.]
MSTDLLQPGGGLTKSKLALADATTGDVLPGKKFYAGDKVIKAGSMANNGAWSSSLAPGGSVVVPQGYHNGGGRVSAMALKTVTITMAPGSMYWSYTFTGGTLVGICDIAETAYSKDIEYLHISGNTIAMKWSGNGIMARQITLIYY